MEGNLKNITVSPRADEIMETLKTEGYFSNKKCLAGFTHSDQ